MSIETRLRNIELQIMSRQKAEPAEPPDDLLDLLAEPEWQVVLASAGPVPEVLSAMSVELLKRRFTE